MPNKLILSHNDAYKRAQKLARTIKRGNFGVKCYPIPRGGVPAAYQVAHLIPIQLVDNPIEADFFIDDIIDSGATMERYCDEYPGRPFMALVDKTEEADSSLPWVVFPWENKDDEQESIQDNIVRLLQFVGEDAARGGLLETPKRVAKAWSFWCQGYRFDAEDIAEMLKCFEDGAENQDEMVVVKGIPFYSHCEHHMAPFFGTATIAYIPDGKIVGLSKLSRLLQVFAKRLQVQERLTGQIADALMEHLEPLGAAVKIEARHMCMESRGISQQGSTTVTTALRGAFKASPETRAEFMAS